VSSKPFRVLFVCTGNSARSIMAEALVNALGRGRVAGASAGSHPKGGVHPLALELIERHGLPIGGLRSKSWDEFALPDSAPLDYVITVCDQAAGEACPAWPGHPATEHWSIADPATAAGSDEDRRRAFETALAELEVRVRALLARPEL
jgi:arsenate reductase